MIDLEDELRASLRAYGDSIEPSAPDGALLSVVTEPDRRRDGRVLLAAAAVVVLALVAVAVLVARDRDDTVSPAPTGPGAWEVIPPIPLSARSTPSVMWTSSEFIVWGGVANNVGLADGAIFEPENGFWRPMPDNPRVRPGGNAVWTGRTMAVLSGSGGEAYDLLTDSWSSLPNLQPGEATPGFSDAVYAGGRLYGIGLWPGPNGDGGDGLRINVWVLDGDHWRRVVDNRPVSGASANRLVSIPDQFVTHSFVATYDGFVMWDGQVGGYRYSASDGWSELPAIDRTNGNTYPQPMGMMWRNGRLTALAHGNDGGGDDLRIAVLDGDTWSPWTLLGPGGVGLANPISVGSNLVILGVSFEDPRAPTFVDLAAGANMPMQGYPLLTTIEQGAAWSGRELLVCGGQRPTNAPVINTDDPSPVSNECAIWRP